jgi:hypothetical protein
VINCLWLRVTEVLEAGQDFLEGAVLRPDNIPVLAYKALLRKEKSDIVRAYNPKV